jgi:hypothetical protein
MSNLNVDPMKRSSIYAIFGRYYGEKLYKLLFDCCDGFCKSVATCLGISASGSTTKVLNQQGNWIDIETPESITYTTKVSVSSQSILTGNTVPVEILPAPGSNKFIQLLSLTVRKNFYTTAYDANLEGNLTIAGSKITSPIFLDYSLNEFDYNIPQDLTSYTYDSIQDKAIFFQTSFNPVAGNGNIDLYITYQIINL